MAAFQLSVRERFEAAHHLTSYLGEPEPVHGHSWVVEALLETEELGPEGMAYDFVAIKKALSELASRFHHRHINEVPPFDSLSPTTEHLARWFCQQLVLRLEGAPLVGVKVWEGPDCAATYRL